MTNIENLLAPISDSLPCGEDYLFSSDFDAIAQARKFDDPSLEQGEWETELKEANWPFVIERSTQLLSEKTKDIRLAVWLTEALALKKGFHGLAQGYNLIAQLCEQYWDHLHPQPEDDDIEQRIGNIGWLLGRTLQLVREIPTTHSEEGNFNAVQWDVANNLVQAIKRAPDDEDELTRGKVTLAQYDAARRTTALEFYTALLSDVGECMSALSQLEAILDSKLGGNDGPSFSSAKSALETIQMLVQRFHRDAGGDPVKSAQTISDVDNDSVSSSTVDTLHYESEPDPGMAISGVIQTRAQALIQLRQVAAFFRKTEPHSPVAYLAEKAAKSGEIPLHVWLRSVIKDDASFAHIGEMLGFEVLVAEK